MYNRSSFPGHPLFPCRRVTKPCVPAEVVIYSDAIFSRIDADTQFMAQMKLAPAEGDTNNTHSLSTDERTRPHLLTYLNRYYSKALHLCTAYLAKDSVPVQRLTALASVPCAPPQVQVVRADNAPALWKERSIHLMFPHNWPLSALQDLADSISDYIVSGIEYDFLLMGYGATDPNVLQREQAMYDADRAITAALNLRVPPLK